MNPRLTIEILKREACQFAELESKYWEPTSYGVTDGKAVGTYFEHKFRAYLRERYEVTEGSSASGIDFPELQVDMKVTSLRQPQSSCPFRSAREKIYGVGYSLLIFVYDKRDDPMTTKGNLDIVHTIFVNKERTEDFQTTPGLRKILKNDGNQDDIEAFLRERMLPVDDIGISFLAKEIISNSPEIGYLTISNALQWRLQYRRVIEKAGLVSGVERLK